MTGRALAAKNRVSAGKELDAAINHVGAAEKTSKG